MDDETLKTNLEVAAAAADDHMTMDLANEVRQASETTAFLADDSIFKVNDESTILHNNDSIVSSTKLLGTFD